MPVATPEQYAEMLDTREGAAASPIPAFNVSSLADAQRGAAGPDRGRLRRHHPGHDRRRRLLRRPHRQGPRDRRPRVREVRARGRQELPDHGRAAHRPLPEARARRTSCCPLIAASEEEVKAGRNPIFQSHMWDGSAVPLDENLEIAQELLPRMKAINAILEVEIGVVGGEEDGVSHDINEHLYTTLDDAIATVEALGLGEQGRYMAALTFGNVHGVYEPGNVKLRPELLERDPGRHRREVRHRPEAARPRLPRRLAARPTRRSPRRSRTASSR